MSDVVKEQNCSINYLRFVFVLAICLMHLVGTVIKPFFSVAINYHGLGYFSFAVDFFFIMAGFFLFFKKETLEQYISQRLLRLWPLLAFSTVFSVLIKFILYRDSFCRSDILNLLLLQGTGLMQAVSSVGVAWFIGVLFWTSIIYYFSKRVLSSRVFIILTCVIVVVFSLLLWLPPGDIIFNDFKGYVFLLGDVNHYEGGITVMLARCFSTVGIGCILAKLQQLYSQSEKLNEIFKSEKAKNVFTVIETVIIFLLCIIMYGGFFDKLIYSYFSSIFLFVLLFFIFINKLGYVSNDILNKKIYNKFAMYSYAIFITQDCVFILADYFLRKYQMLISHPLLVIVSFMFLFIVIGMFSYHSVNYIVNFLRKIIKIT